MFEMLPFLETKREGGNASPESMREFVKAYNAGELPDYQVAAWLMAVFFNGLSQEELEAFTLALAYSGKTVRFPEGLLPVDKHSTGGVGDKTTLVVVPLAAACGAKVAKLSGKGLGFTGGTVDKLSAIPGMSTELSVKEFVDQVISTGCAVSGHSKDLAPAEGKFYSLRDVTATVPSIPLITSSILSKKIAGGARRFVFDVKFGAGAFMETTERALELAGTLVELSTRLGFDAVAVLTNMEQPLGHWVGNTAEVNEAIEVLDGRGPEDTRDLCVEITGAMLYVSKVSPTIAEGKKTAAQALSKKLGLARFREMIEKQGGRLDENILSGKKSLPLGKDTLEVRAQKPGWVSSCDARLVGETLRLLGGGRLKKSDEVDLSAAVEVLKKTGDHVEAGDVLARIYASDEKILKIAVPKIEKAFSIGEEKTQRPGLVWGIRDARGFHPL
jgi:pyrimidine-nucleoside phosphorylase